jgi:TRAP-type C4-dicarboxylate transport system permease large subunit
MNRITAKIKIMGDPVNIIIVGPVLVNVMAQAGFPEVQAAIVVIVGFLIGSVTPPVGVAYFTAATIAQVRLEKVAVALIPYLVGLFLLLFFIFFRCMAKVYKICV